MKTYTIVHYDDEPSNLGWLPTALFDHLCDLFPGLEDERGALKRPEKVPGVAPVRETTITVREARFELVYKMVLDRGSYSSVVKELAQPERCVMIFDLMSPGPAGGLERCGDHLLHEIDGMSVAGKFFLTAYTGWMDKNLVDTIGAQNVWLKPPSIDGFVRAIVDTLGIRGGGNAGSHL